MKILLLVLVVVGAAAAAATEAVSSIAKANCSDRCGDVMVPYPFGIDSHNCAKNNSFLFNCSRTTNSTTLLFENIPIDNISLEDGTITGAIFSSFECHYKNKSHQIFDQTINLGRWPFTISPTRNKLTALGCDTLAVMSDSEGRFGSGCTSMCNNKEDIQIDTSCSGLGCCQTSIPRYLKTLNITIGSIYNHTNVMDFNPCSYAFVAENSFNISGISYLGELKEFPQPPVVLEWVVGKHTCEASEGYSCGSNTNCSYSDTGGGYRCQCKLGFRGNPYLPDGCQDIDECKEPEIYPCQGKCKNTFGNYTCRCPLGMHGDGKIGCKGLSLINIVTVIGVVILVVVITLLTFILFQRRKKEKYFRENGGLLLKHQRIRIFSEAELVKATNNYDTSQFLGEGGFGSVYRGVLDDNTQVAVKKAKGVDRARINEEFQHEMTIVSQVNHKNVVKILGLCLETKVPLLVYEFILNGTLYHHIHDKRSQVLKSWKNRLRIATETALALDYLHSLADPPIIHGDVKSMNILLDDHYTAKVADFGASMLISPNQPGIGSKIQGTFGYLDPEYLMTGNLTVKSDVYSFGVVMVELLTGEKPTSRARAEEKRNIIQYFISSVEDGRIIKVLNFDSANDSEMEEVEVIAHLVRRCLNGSGLKRPTMKEVAEELVSLKKVSDNCWMKQETNEETQCLLGESSSYPIGHGFSSSMMEQMESYSVHSTFDIEQASSSV